ncbi:MAG: hypothetical protein GY711_34330 [bacterium]|nr:hypothetical protein [bacterium]
MPTTRIDGATLHYQQSGSLSPDAWPGAAGKTIHGCEVATLAFLDRDVTACEAITAIKRVERDLATYATWRGLTRPYASAKLVDDTVQRSADGDELRWRVRFVVRALGSPTLEVTFRDRFESNGTFVRESYSTHERFGVWMGRTSYLPLHDADGESVALMIVGSLASDAPVRLMRAVLREQLGNVVERAERTAR